MLSIAQPRARGPEWGRRYLSVVSKQVGVAEGRLRVHRLAVHVPHRWDKDEAGARAALSENRQEKEKSECRGVRTAG